MLAEIVSAGKVKVAPLAALDVLELLALPARTSDGMLPAPAASTTAALAEADHVAAEVHAAAAGHVLQRQTLPAKAQPAERDGTAEVVEIEHGTGRGGDVGVGQAEWRRRTVTGTNWKPLTSSSPPVGVGAGLAVT